MFHAPKPLTGTEIDTLAKVAVKTLGEGIQFESAFLTIERDHPFKVVAPKERGREMFVERLDGSSGKATVGECAPRRGLVVDLGRSKRLLCVNGPLLMKREGESIPQPLQITLHRDSTYTDMTALTRQVFHFTGLSWRSMLPVTEPDPLPALDRRQADPTFQSPGLGRQAGRSRRPAFCLDWGLLKRR